MVADGRRSDRRHGCVRLGVGDAQLPRLAFKSAERDGSTLPPSHSSLAAQVRPVTNRAQSNLIKKRRARRITGTFAGTPPEFLVCWCPLEYLCVTL